MFCYSLLRCVRYENAIKETVHKIVIRTDQRILDSIRKTNSSQRFATGCWLRNSQCEIILYSCVFFTKGSFPSLRFDRDIGNYVDDGWGSFLLRSQAGEGCAATYRGP